MLGNRPSIKWSEDEGSVERREWAGTRTQKRGGSRGHEAERVHSRVWHTGIQGLQDEGSVVPERCSLVRLLLGYHAAWPSGLEVTTVGLCPLQAAGVLRHTYGWYSAAYRTLP